MWRSRDVASHQVGRQRRQSIDLTVGPAVLDRHVLAFDVAGLVQALAECGQGARPAHRRVGLRNPITGIAGCCARAASGHRRRAAEQRDELAPLSFDHLVGGASSVGGTVRPSIRAVSALMTSSNLVDCTTGRSAGLAPLRMRPV